MLRAVKFIVSACLAVIVGGILLLGTSFFSYLRLSASSVRESVQESVPIEFELRRAKVLIEAILPELQAQVRMIAQEEVEIAALASDVADSEERLGRDERNLAQLRAQLRTQNVSLESGGRKWTREQLTEQLARRLDRYQSARLALESKHRLLQKRNESLSAALSALDSTRQRKAELEQKVESLAAQARLVEASKIESGIRVEGSELSEADQLLGQIETRLAVAQRVLDHEQDVFAIELVDRPSSEEDVLAEYDAYFSDPQQTQTLVTR